MPFLAAIIPLRFILLHSSTFFFFSSFYSFSSSSFSSVHAAAPLLFISLLLLFSRSLCVFITKRKTQHPSPGPDNTRICPCTAWSLPLKTASHRIFESPYRNVCGVYGGLSVAVIMPLMAVEGAKEGVSRGRRRAASPSLFILE